MMPGSFLRAAVFFAPLTLGGQSVVSVHSGVVHFSEGGVTIDGQPVEQRFGRFEEIRPGSELRTDRGRAEILLTPGVLLRVDENSSIRMVSNLLTDTKVAFIGGAIAVDSRNGAQDTPVTVTFQNYEVRFRAPGCYRFDSAPARLRIDAGEAAVALNGKTVSATANHTVAFNPALSAGPYINNMDSGLDRWAEERSESIAADNASAATSDNLTADLDNPQTPAYASGGYGGGGYGGGGYTLGADPVFVSPNDLLYSNYGYSPWSPFSLYPGQLFGYIYVPVYRHSPVLGYRPYDPIRHGPYVPPTSRRPFVHTTPTFARRPPSTGFGVHSTGVHAPAVHVGGRR